MISTEQATEMLSKGVSDVVKSEMYAEYLDVMGKFHRYSARNCMLILMQMPEASRVASYKKWQELGRQVRKGEKAIAILAPINHKTKVLNRDGEEEERTWMTFKPVPVFDVSQTDGEELPSMTELVEGDVAGYESIRKGIEAATSATVQYGCDIPYNGDFDPTTNTIRVKAGLSQAQTCKTLAHEVAHSILHAEGAEQSEATRSVKEVQAESVAYVVCKALGIDTEAYSLGYVAVWSEDEKEVLRQLEVVRKTADAILSHAA